MAIQNKVIKDVTKKARKTRKKKHLLVAFLNFSFNLMFHYKNFASTDIGENQMSFHVALEI